MENSLGPQSRPRHVAQAVSPNEVNDLLSQIFGVVPGALESLRNQENLETVGASPACRIPQVPSENGVARLVNIGVVLQNGFRGPNVEGHKALIDLLQHSQKYARHLQQYAHIFFGKRSRKILNSLRARP